ncbi:hypothetical protein RI662_13140 [Brevibacillus agri]|uniref:hypothetical protein n=1 Tax=Brevibacillus agri TaxID=51101 RepID=UPI00287051BC|nr:hypothetical protein [Brevibacillus agri]MDR9505238.1 hypothetical protein [Brevibacillus agri]
MNHRLILLIMTLTIIFFLWGCSSKEKTMTNDQTHESLVSNFTAENLHSIGVSEYRLDSLPYKAQPEFLVFLSEEEEKKRILRWMETAKNKTDISQAKIQKIYVLQFQYQIGEQVVDSKYLAYVEDSNGAFYVKPFEKMVPELNLEKFTEKDIDSIM